MRSLTSSRYILVAALFLIIVAVLPFSLAGQTVVRHATVQRVVTREAGGVVEVEIQISGDPVAPDTQVVTGPDRIVVDFPGAMPSAALRALKVNQGALKGVRSGLFFSNPPITRIVLDLAGPRSYKISTTDHATVVKLSAVGGEEQSGSAPAVPSPQGASLQSAMEPARLRDAALGTRPGGAVAHLSPAIAVGVTPQLVTPQPMTERQLSPATLEAAAQPEPPQPAVTVSYENGMLRIQADKATLSQVLYEVHLRTQAEIAIPAGAEQEKVVANLGPAPARVVLAELLNGSDYNFIFVGEELSLERVILTRRAGNF
jgi:hypothetical protein